VLYASVLVPTSQSFPGGAAHAGNPPEDCSAHSAYRMWQHRRIALEQSRLPQENKPRTCKHEVAQCSQEEKRRTARICIQPPPPATRVLKDLIAGFRSRQESSRSLQDCPTASNPSGNACEKDIDGSAHPRSVSTSPECNASFISSSVQTASSQRVSAGWQRDHQRRC
jgi:hypothetical protein